MKVRSPITSHVLDTSRGRPAAGISLALEKKDGTQWKPLGKGKTNEDGRVEDLLPASHILEKGTYRLTFVTQGFSSFYPEVAVMFEIAETDSHYHIPLLLSPHGYTTYRGS